ncbi:MAG: D-2-hydroxyacid dehydrogenase [Anaerolineaceae bacterium]
MTVALVSPQFARTYEAQFKAAVAAAGFDCELLLLPEDPEALLSPQDAERVEIAFFSLDIFPRLSRGFFAATAAAPNLKWMHVFNAGVDNPVFTAFIERGVRLTTSSGSTARPIAQTAIGGLLMLARRFPTWGESQRRHAWEPVRTDIPPDLDSQTLVVLGVGAIGNEIARLARAIGLYVIGVRRSPRRDEDNVDEMAQTAALHDFLPRADWLALACPLTPETRGIIGAAELALLPQGAHIINIARGEVIDEPAMIEVLRSGRLGGAYLDVVSTEPLPAESPLWDLPNVIISPHNSAIAQGNERRTVDYFLNNLKAWANAEALINEVGR